MNSIKEQISQLNKTSKRSVALYHKIALSIGISDSALGLLYALNEMEHPCSQYELCNELFMPKQTINSTVLTLQKMGMVALTPIVGTKNKKNVALTNDGKNFVEKNICKISDAEMMALEELTPQERDIYVKLNQKYNEALWEKIGQENRPLVPGGRY